ncbi:phage holin [Clostridium nigeriense]|uniref:phage holin n=1 Tax=Clostridium nigeriense TaxID=1805470 RepID=UPI003D34E2EA
MNLDSSRFKNYGLWVSIFALIPIILNSFGIKVVPDEYQAISNAILTILVALGIISNPTTECKWYIDDNKKNKKDSLKK